MWDIICCASFRLSTLFSLHSTSITAGRKVGLVRRRFPSFQRSCGGKEKEEEEVFIRSTMFVLFDNKVDRSIPSIRKNRFWQKQKLVVGARPLMTNDYAHEMWLIEFDCLS